MSVHVHMHGHARICVCMHIHSLVPEPTNLTTMDLWFKYYHIFPWLRAWLHTLIHSPVNPGPFPGHFILSYNQWHYHRNRFLTEVELQTDEHSFIPSFNNLSTNLCWGLLRTMVSLKVIMVKFWAKLYSITRFSLHLKILSCVSSQSTVTEIRGANHNSTPAESQKPFISVFLNPSVPFAACFENIS